MSSRLKCCSFLSLVVEKAGQGRSRKHTFVGLKFAMISLTRPVLLMLVPRVLVILRVGALFAGEDSGPSRSIGVDAMAVARALSSQCDGNKLYAGFLIEEVRFLGDFAVLWTGQACL